MNGPRTVLLALGILALGAAPALAQGAITAQPLPPPAGTPSASAPAPAVKKPPPPPAHRVPVVRPSREPVKKSVPHKPAHATRHEKPAAKAAPKPAAKSPQKPPQKPAQKPAETPPPAPPPPPKPKIDPNKGSSTGLPLPRWAAFRSDDVNLRTGPGMQYPIEWVYHRRDLPVHILREFEVWRLVQEQDGTKGWVHEATLTGRRGYIVQGAEQVLRASPSDTAAPVAKLEPGVVGHIRRCPANSEWCDVQAGDYHGWLKRSAIYGVSPDEKVE